MNFDFDSVCAKFSSVQHTSEVPGKISGYGALLPISSGAIYLGGSSDSIKAPLPTNKWLHLAAVYEGTKRRLYFNGVLKVAENSKSANKALVGNMPLTFGDTGDVCNNCVGTHPFKGKFDSFRISKTARYSKNFAAPYPLKSDGDTIGLWSFHQSQGKTVKDLSGNGLNAIVGDGTWTSDNPLCK